MAKFNLDYYSGENFYSDGDIEKEILKIVKTQGNYESMENVPFPVLYHLSRVRENILNWYPFQEDATCLEIGSGCGAISGLLCERMKKVVSVELSKQRADINMARHERVPNLEIWVGNLNDMVFGEQFDYIVLNGVFEYAPGFTEGDQPCETFLKNIKRLLKPEGILLIAIENRFGRHCRVSGQSFRADILQRRVGTSDGSLWFFLSPFLLSVSGLQVSAGSLYG